MNEAMFNAIFSSPEPKLCAIKEFDTMKARANKSFIEIQGLNHGSKEKETSSKKAGR